MRNILVVLTIISLMGCTKLPKLETYNIDIPHIKSKQKGNYRNKIIKVAYPKSLKESISQNMDFTYSSSERGSYQNSQWSNSLIQLIQGATIELLANSNIYKAVIPITSTVSEDYILESTVYAFYHDLKNSKSKAIVSIEYRVIDSKDNRLIKTKRFSYSEDTPTIDAKGYASATNRAMERLSGDLLRWLIRYI
ncbi:MAG: ABC-type transport auxiliary lipoprotein family protein [Sulfurovum sp.]